MASSAIVRNGRCTTSSVSTRRPAPTREREPAPAPAPGGSTSAASTFPTFFRRPGQTARGGQGSASSWGGFSDLFSAILSPGGPRAAAGEVEGGRGSRIHGRHRVLGRHSRHDPAAERFSARDLRAVPGPGEHRRGRGGLHRVSRRRSGESDRRRHAIQHCLSSLSRARTAPQRVLGVRGRRSSGPQRVRGGTHPLPELRMGLD